MLAGRKFCNTNFKVLTHYDHLNETRAEEEAEVDKNSFWYSCHQLSRCESLFKGWNELTNQKLTKDFFVVTKILLGILKDPEVS